MCPAILSKGFLSVRHSSFANQIFEAGWWHPWEYIAQDLCANERFGTRYTALQADLYLRVLFVQVLAGLGEVATITYVSETVPLIKLCKIGYENDLCESEYIDFCDHLRNTGLYVEMVQKLCDMATKIYPKGGADEVSTKDDAAMDTGACDYSYKPHPKGLLEYLYDQMDGAIGYDISDKGFGFGASNKKKGEVIAKSGHEMKVIKFIFGHRCPEDYMEMITRMEGEFVTKFMKRHTPQYLRSIADINGIEAQLQKNLRVLACWMEANGKHNDTIYRFEKEFKLSLNKSQITDVTKVYKAAGLMGLSNIYASKNAIEAKIPVYWKEFYISMLVICRREKMEISTLLANIKRAHPNAGADIDKVGQLLDHILTATIITEDSALDS